MNLAFRFFTFLSLLYLLVLFSGVQTVEAATVVNTSITTDTTWTAASSPYIIDAEVSVVSGATLTVESGVVVKLSSQLFVVEGILDVNGTEAEPVYFTSYRDDTVGGDSNGDGSSSSPTPRDWRAVQFVSGSQGDFEHAVVRYAGYGNSKKKTLAGIYNTGGDVTISDSIINDNGSHGVGQTGGSLTLAATTISNQNYGVIIFGGDATVSGSTFENNTTRAIFVSEGTGSLELTNNVFTNNNIAMDVNLSLTRVFSHSGNTAAGGIYNGIILRGPIAGDMVLTGEDTLSYLITGVGGLEISGVFTVVTANALTVSTPGSLTFEAGAVIKFTDQSARLVIEGELNVAGTEAEPVHFTSVNDDSVGSLTGTGVLPQAQDWKHIEVKSGGEATLTHATVKYGGSSGSGSSSAGLYNTGGILNIENSEISGNHLYGIRQTNGTTVIHNSSIHGHVNAGIHNQSATVIDAINNFWGDPSGPYHNPSNLGGLGDAVSNNVLFEPWLGEWPPAGTQCCSSVLFLPGIMSSRLYADGEQLWEPFNNEDITELYLDEEGKSERDDVVATEVIDEFEANFFPNPDIYKSFLEDLENASSTGVIAEYTAYPYDWRLSLEDVLADGNLENELHRLASSSKSGKVTIVTHSNGGLLAKALINQLGGEASELIDQVIFVGVPQLGTPKAIASLLHGADAGIPFTYSNEIARIFALNAPMTYQLLPQPDYYDNDGVSISTPLVTFENGSKTAIFTAAYGNEIDSADEFRSFILGNEGRQFPQAGDLDDPARGNSVLYDQAVSDLSAIGSEWQAPEGIVVHQIAGTGELTTDGITYQTIQDCTVRILWHCDGYEDKLSYSFDQVVDGDGTVVVPSALLMSASTENVKRWWVNLQKNNEDYGRHWIFRLNHAGILEVPELREFLLQHLLGGSENTFATYIADAEPELDDYNRLSFTLHSPLTLSLTDTNGDTIDENNPGGQYASFRRYGEIQVIDVFGDQPFTLQLDGQAEGSFTLELTEYDGDIPIATSTFSAIPSATGTVATMEFTEPTIEAAGDLALDYDGDGFIDLILETKEGETVNAPEPTVEDLVAYFKQYVEENVVNQNIRKQLIKDIEHFRKMYEKTKAVKVLNPSVFLIDLKTKINVYARIGKINPVVADELKLLLAIIEEKL